MSDTDQTDAEKLAAARAVAEAASDSIRAAQDAAAPIIAGAAEITKAIQLPHAQGFVDIMAGKEAAALRELLEAHVAASLDDLPKSIVTPGVEGTKQKAERVLAAMRLMLEGGQARVAELQPTPSPVTDTPNAGPAPAAS